ncbi:hypothetical protein [Peribacillus sp. SCS-155]|uniref:hypothetical protein n=1 Tax=Peribacillus sedimenti TaxID=3115297 RepID=UPI003905A588
MALNLDEQYMELFHNWSQDFEDKLLNQAENVRYMIDHILTVGNIDLLNNAHLLVEYVFGEKEEALDTFAEKEGISWASHELTFILQT